MSYTEQRDARKSSEVNNTRHEFEWELEHVPLLHSGFMEPTPNRPEYGILFLSIWFANGSYRIRLQDRGNDEKAFLDCGTLDGVFQLLEQHLIAGTLDWTPDRASRNGRSGT